MAQQYINIEEYLSANNFRVITALKEFCDSKTIVFECPKNHTTKIKNTSFNNKKAKFQEKPENLCSTCLYYDKDGDRFQKLYKQISEKTGHKLASIDKNRKVRYQCGKCNNEHSSFLSNLLKNLGTCPSCQNQKFKSQEEDIKKEIEKICIDHKLVSYKNCKDLELLCPNNHTFTVSLNLFKTGRRCPICAPDRRKKTTLEKYGVDNVSKCENVKEKIINTMQERYGVPYPMQNPEIFKKQLSTSFNTKDFIFPNGRIEKIRGYEDTCITELLKVYKEDEIIVDPYKIPIISYINESDKKCLYFPDIMLPDKLIEVKSTYTYQKHKENNERKFKACAESGYDIEVWIYNRKREIVEKKKYKKSL